MNPRTQKPGRGERSYGERESSRWREGFLEMGNSRFIYEAYYIFPKCP